MTQTSTSKNTFINPALIYLFLYCTCQSCELFGAHRVLAACRGLQVLMQTSLRVWAYFPTSFWSQPSFPAGSFGKSHSQLPPPNPKPDARRGPAFPACCRGYRVHTAANFGAEHTGAYCLVTLESRMRAKRLTLHQVDCREARNFSMSVSITRQKWVYLDWFSFKSDKNICLGVFLAGKLGGEGE